MGEVDRIFFELFGLTENEVSIIQDSIQSAELKVFSAQMPASV